jgi:sugar phosphate isomerase/epimerase
MDIAEVLAQGAGPENKMTERLQDNNKIKDKNMLTRRSFILKSAAAAVATAFVSDALSLTAENKLRKFGFISGIIGKELKGDWKAVLKKTVEYGFSEIETGSFPGESASTFLSFCKEIGLTPVAGGITISAKGDELIKGLNLINELKMKYAVVYWPWLTGGPFKADDCKKSAELLNSLGKSCRENGLTLCWHNHDKEFIPMETGLPFDFLMNNTDSSLVKCELDLYWVKKGGRDPLEVMKKYPRRYPILHVKDMAPGSSMDFECPGSGIIDFPELFKEAEKQGIKHYFVERDNVPDGMACLQSSGKYLRDVTF